MFFVGSSITITGNQLGWVLSNAHALRTAEPSSILSLCLKHSRKSRYPIPLGSLDITTDELLDRCQNNQRELVFFAHAAISFDIAVGTTLALHDNRGREAGALVVQLMDATARAYKAVIDSASHDVERGLSSSTPIPEPIQNIIGSTVAALDLGGGVVNSLKEVVKRSKIVVDFVSETAKVHVASRQHVRFALTPLKSSTRMQISHGKSSVPRTKYAFAIVIGIASTISNDCDRPSRDRLIETTPFAISLRRWPIFIPLLSPSTG